MIFKFLKRKKKEQERPEPIKPEHIPWDVPLDQTTSNWRIQGDEPPRWR